MSKLELTEVKWLGCSQLLRRGLIVMISLSCLSCGEMSRNLEISKSGESTSALVIPAKTAPPLAAVVWIHGLNNSAQSLLPMAEALAEDGIVSRIVSLSGHRPNSPPNESNLESWMAEIAIQHRLMREEHPGLPIVTAGYSMGGVLAIAHDERARLGQFGAVRSDGLLLLAPAIVLPAWFTFTYPVMTLEPLGLPVPSLVPEHARAHRHTSLTTYRQLNKGRAEVFEARLKRRGLSSPMALLYHPYDRLVPSGRLLTWLSRNWRGDYKTWAVECSGCYANHLFLTERDMTHEQWKSLLAQVMAGLVSLVVPL
jgi:alpha-beta hydrolase superfamily lysophospholipase